MSSFVAFSRSWFRKLTSSSLLKSFKRWVRMSGSSCSRCIFLRISSCRVSWIIEGALVLFISDCRSKFESYDPISFSLCSILSSSDIPRCWAVFSTKALECLCTAFSLSFIGSRSPTVSIISSKSSNYSSTITSEAFLLSFLIRSSPNFTAMVPRSWSLSSLKFCSIIYGFWFVGPPSLTGGAILNEPCILKPSMSNSSLNPARLSLIIGSSSSSS